jgi:hypothetical protein
MDVRAKPNLEGRRILIVESEVAFGPELQDALERVGAETVIVRDPYSDEGARRIAAYAVCAAVINDQHRNVANTLNVPVLVYGQHAEVPARADAIMHALKRLLSQGR